MPSVTVNLGNSNNGAAPDGIYEYEVQECKLTTSKSGKPMLASRCRIVAPSEQEGKVLFINNTLDDPENGWALDRFLNAVGIDTPQTENERKTFAFDTEDIEGRSFVAEVVKQEAYNSNNMVRCWSKEQADAQKIALGSKVAVEA